MAKRSDLIKIVTRIQNRTCNWNRDILTICGMCSDAEIADHAQREFSRLDDEGKADVVAYTRSLVEA